MHIFSPASRLALIAVVTVAVLLAGCKIASAQSSWWSEPAVRACCSEADAVWADEWTARPDGSVVARVTGGGPRNHDWAPIGREYEVPADRVLTLPGNPTGRAMLFLSPWSLTLFCFAPGPMI